MRGIENKALKEICIEMFNQGITQKDIMQQIEIKRSTLSDYYKSWRITKENIGELKKEKNLKHFNSIDNTGTRIESIISSYIKENISDTEWFLISRTIKKELIILVNNVLDVINNEAKLLSNTNNLPSVKNYRPLVSHVDTDV